MMSIRTQKNSKINGYEERFHPKDCDFTLPGFYSPCLILAVEKNHVILTLKSP